MKNPYRLLVSLLVFVILTVAIYFAFKFLKPVFGIYVCQAPSSAMMVSPCAYSDKDWVYMTVQFLGSPIAALLITIVGFKLLGRKTK